jgi:predicted dehydrogenase
MGMAQTKPAHFYSPTTVQRLPADRPVRAALVGYGSAGRIFHAPLLSGAPGIELSCIVSSKPDAVRQDWPNTLVVATVDEAFANPDIDLVVIATSNQTHHPLARAALLAGKHVVVDKPCTVTLAETEDLLGLACTGERMLAVFQNRRFDADFLALREVVTSGELGRLVHFESHYDRYRPEVLSRWRDDDIPGSGLWVDLGAHLVDQALQLFGVPDDIAVDLAQQRDGARTNDYFHAQFRYDSHHPGLRVVLHGSALVPKLGPRYALHGTKGSFIKYGLDTQEDALKTGARPQWGDLAAWGRDPDVGELVFPQDGAPARRAAPDLPGNYLAYYGQVAAFLRGEADAPPVTPTEVYQVMAVLERGRHSADKGHRVDTSDLRNA